MGMETGCKETYSIPVAGEANTTFFAGRQDHERVCATVVCPAIYVENRTFL